MGHAKRINLGAGDKPLDGYENWDRKTGQEAYPLAVEDNSLELIRASHILEHFPRNQVLPVLKDWCRALQPGGILKLSVPDFKKIAENYVARQPGLPYDAFVMGSQTDANDFHYVIFDWNLLSNLLMEAGFGNIITMPADAPDCSSLPISLNIQAEKPFAPLQAVKDTIFCLASARFGPILHHKSIDEAINRIGLPTAVEISCFWHSTMCNLLERACDHGFKYVITDDYDSIFSEADILTLYQMMEAFPEADAIAPLQQRRGKIDVPLYSVRNENWRARPDSAVRFREQHLVPVDTAHFGLTIIRLDKLRAMPKPWMLHLPNPDGSYIDGGGIDADIYFWKKWHEQGNNLFISPRVVIGHVEEVVIWPDLQGKKQYQVYQDYLDHGIPRNVIRTLSGYSKEEEAA